MNIHLHQTGNSSKEDTQSAGGSPLQIRKMDDSYSREELSAYLSVLAEAVVRIEEKLDELSQQI